MDFEMEDWYFNKQFISRQFSINAYDNIELLILNLTHLHQMEQEFLDCYEALFENSLFRLKKAWVVKLAAIQECNDQQMQWKLEKLKEQEHKNS